MPDARANILARLRAASRDETLPEIDFTAMAAHGWSPLEKLDFLRHRMEAAHAEFLDCHEADWVTALQAWLLVEGVPALIHGTDGALIHRLKSGWTSEGIELIAYDRPLEDWKSELFSRSCAGLTCAAGAIAETGTVIVRTGPAEPRTLSLVPPISIILLDVSNLYETMWQAQREQGWAAAMPSNLVLISGPSRTADIEQVLAYGVHGPVRLLVVLVRAGEIPGR